VERRVLSAANVRAIVRAEIEQRIDAAEKYERSDARIPQRSSGSTRPC
jgi:hypothetical protein